MDEAGGQQVANSLSYVHSWRAALEIYVKYNVVMQKVANQTKGHTYTRMDRELESREYLAYGVPNSTIDPDYWSTDLKRSLTFENQLVMSLRSTGRMNPCAIIENVPFSGSARTLSIFMYHAYGFKFEMHS